MLYPSLIGLRQYVKDLSQNQLQKLASRAGSVPEVTPIPGATSSDLYLLQYPLGQYPDRREVLRVFRAERWDIPARDLSIRELRILESLTQTSLPAPAPIATFESNGVIMSWLPGAVILPRRPDAGWLATLARTLARIHQSGIEVPFTYESWNDTRANDRPGWWQDRALWANAQAHASKAPDFDPVFIHRDYHPVNVLWEESSISGVVDWINACMGPAGIDVAHCRLNLAIMYGPESADGFLEAYRATSTDYQHDYYWDLEDALGALPDVEPYAPWAEFGLRGLSTEMVRTRLVAFIEAATQRI